MLRNTTPNYSQGGYVLVVTMLVMALVLTVGLTVTQQVLLNASITGENIRSDIAYYAAEAHVEDIMYELKEGNIPDPVLTPETTFFTVEKVNVDGQSIGLGEGDAQGDELGSGEGQDEENLPLVEEQEGFQAAVSCSVDFNEEKIGPLELAVGETFQFGIAATDYDEIHFDWVDVPIPGETPVYPALDVMYAGVLRHNGAKPIPTPVATTEAGILNLHGNRIAFQPTPLDDDDEPYQLHAKLLSEHLVDDPRVSLTPGDYSAPDITHTSWGGHKPHEWAYIQRLTINTEAIACTEALPSFPVYVDLSDMPKDFFVNAMPEGTDIVVAAVIGDKLVKLPRELVSYSKDYYSGELWFRAPSLDPAAAPTFYILYGNAGVNENANIESSQEVWNWDSSASRGYTMVQHLNEDPSEYPPTDSSRFTAENDGVFGGNMARSALVWGKIAEGIFFDGVDDIVTIPQPHALAATDELTIEAWVRPFGTEARTLMGYFSSAGKGTYLAQAPTFSQLFASLSGEDEVFYSSGEDELAFGEREWAHVALRYDKASGGELLFNGEVVQDIGGGEVLDTGHDFVLGSDNKKLFHGIIDELRVSNRSHSSCWLQTTYNNQNDPRSFYTIDPNPYLDPTRPYKVKIKPYFSGVNSTILISAWKDGSPVKAFDGVRTVSCTGEYPPGSPRADKRRAVALFTINQDPLYDIFDYSVYSRYGLQKTYDPEGS